jgi:hypothetical protein
MVTLPLPPTNPYANALLEVPKSMAMTQLPGGLRPSSSKIYNIDGKLFCTVKWGCGRTNLHNRLVHQMLLPLLKEHLLE